MHNHNQIYSLFALKGSVDSGLSRNELIDAFHLTCLMFNVKEEIEEIIDEMIGNGFIYIKNGILFITKNKKFLSYKKHIDLILSSYHSYSILKDEYETSDEEGSDASSEEEDSEKSFDDEGSDASSHEEGSEKSVDDNEDTFNIVKSDTYKDVYYIIDVYNKECSCPSFKYCKKTEKTCKHIDSNPLCIITSNLSKNKHTCDCNFKKNGNCIHIKNFISYYELNDVVHEKKEKYINKSPKSSYTVKSMTNPSKSYTINLDDNTCTCPSFTYCKQTPKTCKHLK